MQATRATLCILLALPACDRVLGLERGIDARAGWSEPAPLGFEGDDPTLTADLLELYLDRSGDIFAVDRAVVGGSWSAPRSVMSLSTSAEESTPELSPDGLTIFFTRENGAASFDIWVSMRAPMTETWDTPVVVVELSSPTLDIGGSITSAGLQLAISSTRDDSDGDIYESRRASRGDMWGMPVAVGGINTAGAEIDPFLTADGLSLLFASDRDGDLDLYRAQRAAVVEPFLDASALDELNSPGMEGDPWMSDDGRLLFWSSTRSGPLQIYFATFTP